MLVEVREILNQKKKENNPVIVKVLCHLPDCHDKLHRTLLPLERVEDIISHFE